MSENGGQSLGKAQGKITIDTSDLARLQAISQQVGQQVGKNLGQIDKGAKQAQSGLVSLSSYIGKLKGELASVGVAGGLFTGLGLKTAAGLQETNIQLVGMLGNQRKASALMDDVRKKAAAAGVTFGDLLAASKQILPSLQGNTDQLGKWLGLVQRVATLNPQEGIRGAAFSINEAITSRGKDVVSLAERFNLSKADLRDALEQTNGDFAAALDIVLTKMGITQETADKMGKTFNAALRSALDAATQLAGAGFTPLLNSLTPLLQGTTKWLTELQATNPQIATLGAGIASIAAVGAPSLLLLNQLVEAANKLKIMGALGAMGKAGGVAGAVVGGFGLGVAIDQGIGKATGAQSFQNITGEGELNKFIHAADLAGSYLIDFTNVLARSTAGINDGMSRFFAALGIEKYADSAKAIADAQRRYALEGEAITNRIRGLGSRALMGDRDDISRTTLARSPAGTVPNYTDDQVKVITEWATSVTRIEREANAARLAATQQYESQRSSAIAQHEQSIAREAQDFAISRQRQAAQLNATIADIQANSVKQAAKWQQDLAKSIAKNTAESNKRISEITEASNKRIADIDDEYNKSSEQAARSHRDSLMEAAGNLDARAVATEQRRYAQSAQEAATAHDDALANERAGQAERIQAEQESLAERIQQDRDANAVRLADAATADAERIADAKAALATQQAQEDADRALRTARTAEDFALQLKDLDAQQVERMKQIDTQQAEQRAALDESFQAELDAQGIHNKRWLDAQKKAQDKALESYKKWLDSLQAAIPTATTKTQGANPDGTPLAGQDYLPSFTSMITLLQTIATNTTPVVGASVTGASVGEAVKTASLAYEYARNPRVIDMVNAAGSNSLSQQRMGALGGGRGASLSVGTITINALPGQSPIDIAGAVRKELTGLFREIVNGG